MPGASTLGLAESLPQRLGFFIALTTSIIYFGLYNQVGMKPKLILVILYRAKTHIRLFHAVAHLKP